MVVRYHWGLGIGHVYSHSHNELPTTTVTGGVQSADAEADDPDAQIDPDLQDNSDTENPEFGFMNDEDDLGEADEPESFSDSGSDHEFLAMADLYWEGS